MKLTENSYHTIRLNTLKDNINKPYHTIQLNTLKDYINPLTLTGLKQSETVVLFRKL
jgi:hypothetical protein